MKATDTSRRAYRRRAVQLEVKITFRPPASFASVAGVERLMLVGRTRNVSETGVALAVSARNIDRYLNAKDNTFDLELRLPDGAVALASDSGLLQENPDRIGRDLFDRVTFYEG